MTELKNLDDLEASWREWMVETNDRGKLTQGGAWRRDNPGEWEKLKLYYQQKAARPNLGSRTGKQMVELVDGLIEARGEAEPPPTEPPPSGEIVPAPPAGPFTIRDGYGTVASFPDCWSSTASPFTVRGKHVKNVTFSGVGSQQPWVSGPSNNLPIENPGRTLIEDCIVENVSRAQGGAAGGTGEAAAWLGNPTDMRRCVLRDAAWMLMNLVARSHSSLIEDVLMEDAPVGMYFEHYAHHYVVRRAVIRNIAPRPVAGGSEPLGILAARSITTEWVYNNPTFGGRVCPHTIDFVDCDIYCPPRDPRFQNGPTGFDPSAGAYLGPGTHTIRFLGRTRFWGPGWAIYAPTVRLGPDVEIASTVRFENGGPKLSYHSLPMGA